MDPLNHRNIQIVQERIRLQKLALVSPSEFSGVANSSFHSSSSCPSDPLFPNASPITQLVNNLGETCLDSTPEIFDVRKRLSLNLTSSSIASGNTPLTTISNLPRRTLCDESKSILISSVEKTPPVSTFWDKENCNPASPICVPSKILPLFSPEVVSSPRRLAALHGRKNSGNFYKYTNKSTKPILNEIIDPDILEESNSQDSGYSDGKHVGLGHNNGKSGWSRSSSTEVCTSSDEVHAVELLPMPPGLSPDANPSDSSSPRNLISSDTEDEAMIEDGFDLVNDDDFVLDSDIVDGQRVNTSDGSESHNPKPPILTSLMANRVLYSDNDSSKQSKIAWTPSPPLSIVPKGKKERMISKKRSVMEISVNDAKEEPPAKRRSLILRRCQSLVESSSSFCQPNPTCVDDFESPVSRTSAFKRPIPLSNASTSQQDESSKSVVPSKQRRLGGTIVPTEKVSQNLLTIKCSSSTKRCTTTNEDDDGEVPSPSDSESSASRIMNACDLAEKQYLTADRGRPLSLSILEIGAQHQDLRTITCRTLYNLMTSEQFSLHTYRLIDARYAYEFEAGHIRGAENFGCWDEDKFFQSMLPSSLGPIQHPREFQSQIDQKRTIVIFHCEFSSARAPELMKKLRHRDRALNKDVYPALYYPECYLLHKGYKEFYKNHGELCDPRGYLPMKDPKYAKEERTFRTKSKSWAGGGTVSRTGASSRLLKM